MSFPVGAVAGGVAGGVASILLVLVLLGLLAVVYCRPSTRRKTPQLDGE